MNDLYFDTIDTGALCREGGNGPDHPSQIRGLELVDKGESLLDIGCGSATTLECIQKRFADKEIKYKGVDFVPRHVKWCQENFSEYEFEVQEAMKLKEKDKSWDVVWSRHVVDHLPSFEKAIDEYCRIARKKVICILWHSFTAQPEHLIRKIKMGGKTYKHEYLNDYSLVKTVNWLINIKYPEWTPTFYFKIGLKDKAQDTIIYLYRQYED